MPVIGYLSQESSVTDAAFLLPGFRQGLNEAGYVEGQNVAIEYRWAESQYDRLPGLAADLVGRKVDVIAAIGVPPRHSLPRRRPRRSQSSSTSADPVQAGLVASLNRPGGNVTGVANFGAELAAKRLDLLHELVPTASSLRCWPIRPTPILNPKAEACRRQREPSG
jgi:putative tryptophan/tyrosine transport system substrate-binding protein